MSLLAGCFFPIYGTALSQCHLRRRSNQLNSVSSFFTYLENLWLHSFKPEEEIVCLKAYLILLNITSQSTYKTQDYLQSLLGVLLAT